ncbi:MULTISPECIES: pantoate--beta-alanine ligase [unclassified Corynebacterium]|uniref:pantoate--beta-alanine ligase n=1 Tax=unclassified Corynebacterium TaxID=2624378 RepID=UPI0037BEE20A
MDTIFVNPLQYSEEKQLDAYPGTVEDHLATLLVLGLDYVFMTETSEIKPHCVCTVDHLGPVC